MKTKNSTTPNVKRDFLMLISVPLILASLLALVVYIPQLLANPSQNFIYQTCTTYWCEGTHKVMEGSIVLPKEKLGKDRAGDEDYYEGRGDLVLYLYDVSTNDSKPLSRGEALKYEVDNTTRSRDGYELIKEHSAGGLFDSSYNSSWVLKDGVFKSKIKLVEGDYYGDTIKFIGWVK